MLTIPPTKFVKRRGRIKPRATTPTPPPPAELVLVAAGFDGDELTLTLTFDRAVDIAGIVAGADLLVDDGATLGKLYEAVSATLLAADTVRVTMTLAGDSVGDTLTLTATAGTGIVAADDGGTWAGATNLGLPFP
jgi:hypothetical protein